MGIILRESPDVHLIVHFWDMFGRRSLTVIPGALDELRIETMEQWASSGEYSGKNTKECLK